MAKKISILLSEDMVLTALSGVIDIFGRTNQFLVENGKPAFFEIELISDKMRNVQMQFYAQFMSHKTLDEFTKTDIIIVPAFYTDPDTAIKKNEAFIHFLKYQYALGTEIASLCSGAVLLAEAGILDGKNCTSHWAVTDYIKQKYPKVNVLPDEIITDYNGVYTSGAAFSSFNLIIYLIEKFCGKDVSIAMSKLFSIDIDKVNQSHFKIFQGYKYHNDDEILAAQELIETKYAKDITVDDVASKSCMSKRNFIRRFKLATQSTPLEYIQRVKVEAAKKLLEQQKKDINEIRFEVGYNDSKTFRNIFKRYTGLTPNDYRKKYSRVLAA